MPNSVREILNKLAIECHKAETIRDGVEAVDTAIAQICERLEKLKSKKTPIGNNGIDACIEEIKK